MGLPAAPLSQPQKHCSCCSGCPRSPPSGLMHHPDLAGPPVLSLWPSPVLSGLVSSCPGDRSSGPEKMDRVTEEADGLFILFHLEVTEGSDNIAGRHEVKPVVHLIQK
ncbi:hypothetical protein AALO_G00207440, partial [Alosa alosa]